MENDRARGGSRSVIPLQRMKHSARLIFGLVLSCVAVAAAQPTTADRTYRIVAGWAPFPAGADLDWEVPSVALSPRGDRLYAFRRSNPPIVEIDTATGRVLKTWGENMFVWPHAISVDRSGNIWAADATIGAPPMARGLPLAPKGVPKN